MLKKVWNLIIGFIILFAFYFISLIIVKLIHMPLPPAILGLILFAIALIQGYIKEEWIKIACDLLIKNMAMFLVPFMAGLIVYKSLLLKNWLVIFLVIFVVSTLTILITGLFVEWGLKLLRLYNIKKAENKHD